MFNDSPNAHTSEVKLRNIKPHSSSHFILQDTTPDVSVSTLLGTVASIPSVQPCATLARRALHAVSISAHRRNGHLRDSSSARKSAGGERCGVDQVGKLIFGQRMLESLSVEYVELT